MWSWVLEAVGLTGALVVGKKHFFGWVILLVNTALWAVYGLASKQYGFTVASALYAPVYAKNLVHWFRTRHNLVEREAQLIIRPE